MLFCADALLMEIEIVMCRCASRYVSIINRFLVNPLLLCYISFQNTLKQEECKNIDLE